MVENEQKVQNWKNIQIAKLKKVQDCEVSWNLNYKLVQIVSQCVESQVLMHVIHCLWISF